MKVISQKQYADLLENNEKMGHIYDIRINVKQMSTELINYCAFDVLYLQQLYKSFPKNDNYQKLIPEITSVHFILKNTEFFQNSFQVISKFNLTILKLNNNFLLLKNLFKFMYYWIDSENYSYILSITYFRKFFNIIIKYII